MPGVFIYPLYWLVQILAFPLLLLYLAVRVARDRRYLPGMLERFGALPHSLQRTAHGSIWLHAVSVGEVIAAIPLIRRLRETLPGAPVYVSCGTIAGLRIARERLADLTRGAFYAPLDYRFAVRRALRRIRPSLVIVLETEIWPNLFRETRRSGAGLLIVNGRISDRAIARYQRFAWFFRSVLDQPNLILTQSARMTWRFLECGAPRGSVREGGNLKYDMEQPGPTPADIGGFVAASGASHVFVAASTMPGRTAADVDEDEAVLAAFEQLGRRCPGLLLIIAPRRPERFERVENLLRARRLSFAMRSRMPASIEMPGVLLLDTVGELFAVMRLATVVFMGGTLAERGGHNILEPACLGKPIVIGPNMQNFAEIAEQFDAGGGVARIDAPAQLAETVGALLDSSEARSLLGDAAGKLAQSSGGATGAALVEAVRVYEQTAPRVPPFGPVEPVLKALSFLWRIGSQWKAARSVACQRRLPTPVISVGSISMGGAGKTPFTVWLAREMLARGVAPAMLTRGYKRRSLEPVTVIERAGKAPVGVTGDEAQILLRSGAGPLGIGSDRYASGMEVARRFKPDVCLLDDGFQHRRLHRDADLVLIDTLDPFGQGAVFPAGRLREPLTALSRATAFVLTRTEPGRTYDGIVERLREWNPRARIWRSRVRPLRWMRVGIEESFHASDLPHRRVIAFSGLGNPASFSRSLEECGIEPVFRCQFGDHHVYLAPEIRTMVAQAKAQSADALVTTEKDVMNLDAACLSELGGLPLYWLEIGVEVERGDDLVGELIDTLLGVRADQRPSGSP